jgi:5-methylcytosine-specific restriction endonuclease McrA
VKLLPKAKGLRLMPAKTAHKSKPRARRAQDDYARIAYDTRLFVWNRDRGRCCHCGSGENLQFDHIIPQSKGGSGCATNVELLCGTCNNKKKARLSAPSGD